MSIKSEILDIAEEHGYTGTAKTTAAAINALADTLAGEDVAGGRTVASAIHALGPYIGAGGGGGEGGFGAAFLLYSNQNGGSFYGATDGQVLYMSNFSSNYNYPTVTASGIDIYCAPGFTPYTCTGVTLEQGGTTTPIAFESGQSMLGTNGLTKFTIPALDFDGGYDAQGMPKAVVRVSFTS